MGEFLHQDPRAEPASVLTRRTVLDTLDAEIVLARELGCPLVVMMVGIDRLDLVVRWCGLPARAEVLHESAARLVRAVRRSDAVGRYGEEEFLLVLPCCRERNACATAHRLRGVLHAAPLAAAGHPVEPYATIGVVAGLPRGLSSPEVLVLAARRALWRARRSGGQLEMATADDFSGERRRSPP